MESKLTLPGCLSSNKPPPPNNKITFSSYWPPSMIALKAPLRSSPRESDPFSFITVEPAEPSELFLVTLTLIILLKNSLPSPNLSKISTYLVTSHAQDPRTDPIKQSTLVQKKVKAKQNCM